MKKLLEKLLSKWLEKPLRKLARQIEKLGALSSYPESAQEKEADGPGADVESESSSSATSAHADAGEPSALPWAKCTRASCWDGNNAEKRCMNMLSPKFPDKKFGDYLAWTIGRGCDHLHVFLINEGDGEGSGYDCCTDARANALALERIKIIRSKGLGVVLWVIADDSPNYRPRLFANPAKYAKGARNLLPYASAIVVGLEMDEGKPAPSVDQWKSVRSAFRSFADVPFGVHHTSGNEFKYASLGDFICGQLDPSASVSDIKKQIAAIRAKGKEAVGFEYERKPNRAKAQAALDAGAHAVGNW